jgi:hypothetical protein
MATRCFCRAPKSGTVAAEIKTSGRSLDPEPCRKSSRDLNSTPMPQQRRPSFERMEASLLACPKCKRAVKVRKRLLLVLPQGDKYLYVCPDCGSTCGETIETPPPLVGKF